MRINGQYSDAIASMRGGVLLNLPRVAVPLVIMRINGQYSDAIASMRGGVLLNLTDGCLPC